jgi:hypothetical protein
MSAEAFVKEEKGVGGKEFRVIARDKLLPTLACLPVGTAFRRRRISRQSNWRAAKIFYLFEI